MPHNARDLTLLAILTQQGIEVLPALHAALDGPLTEVEEFAPTLGQALALRRIANQIGGELMLQPGNSMEQMYMAGLKGEALPAYLRPQPQNTNIDTDHFMRQTYLLGQADSRLYRK